MFKNSFILKTQSIVYKCQGIVLSKDGLGILKNLISRFFRKQVKSTLYRYVCNITEENSITLND